MTESTSPKVNKDQLAVTEKIDSMPEPYRSVARRLHEVILSAGPKLKPRLWYGMPGYATARSAPVLVFFRLDDDLMSVGITEKAYRAPGPDAPDTLMPCAWYLTELDDAGADRIAEVVRAAFAE
ncbi:DUF1801 domain-containing protein [Gordonia alkaliphila]|uniref:DUF1801 domain-containing protein n=1 Tax=Gordonia alkaliphila TaxID=1053547 RepID=A0ABP8Z7K6_9ACTN